MDHDDLEEDHRLSDSEYDIDDNSNIKDHLDSYELERAGQGAEQEPLPSRMSNNVMIQLRIPKKEESSLSSSAAWCSSSSSSMEVENDDVSDEKKKKKKKQKVEKQICGICNKGFSSVKALGGHMRVHVQLRRFDDDLKEIPPGKLGKFPRKVKKTLVAAGEHSKRKKRYYAGNSNNNNYNFRDLIMKNGKPTCSLCNKSFPSQKSLFGHMRCHPEREWRGMLPPPQYPATKNSSSSTVSDATPRAIQIEDHFDSAANTPANSSAAAAVTAGRAIAIDLRQSISGWSRTAKRGRKSLISSSYASEEDNDHIPDLNAVFGLMLLANSGEQNYNSLSSSPSDDENKPKEVKLEVDCEVRSNCQCEGDEIGDKDRLCDYYISLKKKKMMKQRQLDQLTGAGENLSNSPTSKKLRIKERAVSAAGAGRPEEMVNSECSNFGMEEEEVGVGMGVDVDEENDNEIMSGKKRRKRKMMKLRDLDLLQLEEVEVEVEAEEVVVREREGEEEEEKYRCATCNKGFLTHQALGGHRSSHYKFKNYYFVGDSAPAAAAPAFAATAASTQEDHVEEETVAASAFAAAGLTSAAAAVHFCRICKKSFQSGQALGGHKRCHWTGGGSSAVESSPSAAAAGSSSCPVQRRILSFDLNELPATEEEEECAAVVAAAAENKSTFS